MAQARQASRQGRAAEHIAAERAKSTSGQQEAARSYNEYFGPDITRVATAHGNQAWP